MSLLAYAVHYPVPEKEHLMTDAMYGFAEIVRKQPGVLFVRDGGPISIYYASRTLLPSKTRVFVVFVVQAFKRDRLVERFAGSLG